MAKATKATKPTKATKATKPTKATKATKATKPTKVTSEERSGATAGGGQRDVEPGTGVNVVVLRGRLSSEPVVRRLPSGDDLRQYEVTVREADGTTASVPVVLVAGRPPAGAGQGSEVVVTGRVRRRFFRAGGATMSRTEVVADRVMLAGRRTTGRAVEAALERAGDLS